MLLQKIPKFEKIYFYLTNELKSEQVGSFETFIMTLSQT